jgi:quercetin dioxygenase-like cupin family protein
MDITSLITEKIDWQSLPQKEFSGERGIFIYRETRSGGFNIRLSEYSADYKSNHWCGTGHIIHCIRGKITLHFKNKDDIELIEGNSVIIGADEHMASTGNSPALLFIIDNI